MKWTTSNDYGPSKNLTLELSQAKVITDRYKLAIMIC